MDNQIYLRCALCKKNAKFVCQRCSDPYCSQRCQIVHWPMHRAMCFPMPNLISATNLMLSLYDAPSIQYPAISNAAMPNKMIREKEHKMIKGKENRENHDEKVNQTFRNPTQSRKTLTDNSSECTELSRTKNVYPSLEAYRSEKKSQKWDEQFPIDVNDAVIEVVVQYFIESPTTNCWVIQRKHVNERNDFLKEMNKLHREIDAIRKDEVKINDLFCVLLDGDHHRCVIVYRINSHEFVVRLIDHGRTLQTRLSAIKPLSQTARDLNAFAYEINFENLRDIKIDEVLQVEKISVGSDGVVNVRIAENEKVFTLEDMEMIQFPVNVPLELFCLDHSNIKMGYISACINDPQKIRSINGISDKIFEYCKQLKGDIQGYCPKLDELCLVYLDDEDQWYRAECVNEVNSNTFDVMFIDYGNVRSVNSKNIRKMDKKFLEPPSIMQLCAIAGVPEKPNSEVAAKIISYLEWKPIFRITKAEDSDFMQIIHVPDLLKAIE